MIAYEHHIIQQLINCGLFFSLATGTSFLFRNSVDKTIPASKALFIVSMGLIMLPAAAWHYFAEIHPVFISLMALFPLLTGPALYLYTDHVTGTLQTNGRNFIKHLLPIPLFLFILLILHLFTPIGRQLQIEHMIRIISLIQYIHITFYFFGSLKKILDSFDQNRKGEVQILMFLFITYLIVINLLLIPAIILGKYFHPSYISVIVILCIHLFLVEKYPFLTGILTERRKLPMDDTSTPLINFKDLQKKLVNKLEQNRLYLYEDLTLAMLAHELGIHSYQLSQLLNTHMGQNFSSLINSYRVRDARHMLIHEPEKSILTIAFEVGFSSKASFNRVFKQITKLSPSEYRQFFIKMSNEHFY